MLITLSGVSGIGKSFFKDKLISTLGMKNLVIYTTRNKRDKEIPGIDKHFVTNEEFDILIKEEKFAYYFELLGNRYGYAKDEVFSDEFYVTELHYEGIRDFKDVCPDIFAIYLIPQNIEDVNKQLKTKRFNENDKAKRLQEYYDFEKSNLKKDFNLILYNNYDLESENHIINAIKKRIQMQKPCNYFTLEEDLDQIIKNTLEKETISSIYQIPTGWTNIVFEVKTDKNVYFFRFPRNDFWSRMMVKDYTFCNHIYGKTSFDTPNMKLHYNKNRPFSTHIKIDGVTLNECMEDLTKKEIENISKEIIQFINELKQISIKSIPLKYKLSIEEFLNELATLHFDNLNVWKQKLFKKYHTRDNVVHGDLNPGNIIIKNKKVVGILDFCFAGYGNPYVDLSRIIGRSPNEFKESLIKYYELSNKTKIDRELLDEFIKAWSNIDNSYINYIRKNNPDIVLPEIV